MIGTGMALLLGGLAAGGASVASAKIGSNAAKKAAEEQSRATDSSAQGMREALELQREMYRETIDSLAPWRSVGEGALTQLNQLLAPGGALRSEYGPYNADDVQFDPGFDFRMKQSNDAIMAWRAARGGVLAPAAGVKLQRNTQDLASQEYQNAYGRSRDKYMLNRDNFLTNQSNLYNRIAGLADMGLGATNQQGSVRQAFGNAASNTAAAVGGAGEAGAAARGAGYVGGANAWTESLANIANMFSNNLLLGTEPGQAWLRNRGNTPVGTPTFSGYTPGYGNPDTLSH